MLKVLIIFAIVQISLSQTPVKRCGSKPMPTAVYFGGRQNFCTSPPCKLKRGTTAITEIDFISPIDTKTAVPRATAKVFGMQVDLKLNKQNGCSMLKNGCPLVKGATSSFKLVKPVEKDALTGTADVQYILIGDNDRAIFCFTLKTTVV
jgi:hypothetical protein